MPKYAKFIKDVLSKKRKLGKFEMVVLTKECSSILKNKIPPKLKDPGSFIIPCFIGSNYCGKPLCDLGASINLMPMSVFKKLGIEDVRPTTVTLQLANRSFAYPEGKLKMCWFGWTNSYFLWILLCLTMKPTKKYLSSWGGPSYPRGKHSSMCKRRAHNDG